MMIGIISPRAEEIAPLCDKATVYPSLRAMMRPLLREELRAVGIDLDIVPWPLVDALFGLPVVPPILLFGGECPSDLSEGVDYLDDPSPQKIADALSKMAKQAPVTRKTIQVWPDSRILIANGATVTLTWVENCIFQLLLSHGPSFLPYQEMLAVLRKSGNSQDYKGLRLAISRLRRKLMGLVTISNVYGKGYRIELGEYAIVVH